MNNNRGNNRRRGRGNNRQNGGNGGQQLNRIDSRARGNAPQMLEKYRKLAHDAHLNGDRVQAEYYLQFADHYFRVIADTRLRQEEQRQRQSGNGERWQDNSEEGESADDFAPAGDFPSFDQQSSYGRRDREERAPREDRDNRGAEGGRGNDGARPSENAGEITDEGEAPQGEGEPAFEPSENPFVRPARGAKGLRPRRDDRRPRRGEGETSDDLVNDERGSDTTGLDASILPPAISAGREAAVDDDAAPSAPRRRTRKPRAAAEEAAE